MKDVTKEESVSLLERYKELAQSEKYDEEYCKVKGEILKRMAIGHHICAIKGIMEMKL